MITVVSLSEIPLTRGGAMPGQADAAPSARPTRLAMVRRASPLSSRGAEMAEKGAEINNAPANKQADLIFTFSLPMCPRLPLMGSSPLCGLVFLERRKLAIRPEPL